MSDFLKQLNKNQLEAVTHINGPTMVIAGAGSGKTRVLTYRIAYLLSKGIDPFNILALTFTNKAAREMKERVINLIGDGEARNVWMGTFHSVFAKILRIEGHYLGYPSNYTIYDSNDSKRLIKNIISDMKLDTKQYPPSYVSSRISMAKSSLISTEEYASDIDIQAADESARKPYIKEIYSRYQSRLKRADAMDFDDLLFNTYILFSRFPKVLYKYQQKFKYTLVDEYQDTNHAQYLIVKKLAANTEQICVVGDDAQSIYGFRGANISNILNFKSDYPDFKMFKLEQNYRSTKTIVQAANQIISFNKDQIKKTVWTDNNTGNKIGYFKTQSDTEEGKMIANSIFEKKMNEQLSNEKFTILYRTNAQSRSLEEALRQKNIPYRIYGGLSFYSRKEIKDLLAYFRLVINNNDEDALQRIINTPARGIGKTTIEKIIVAADINNVNIWEIINNPSQYGLKVNSGIVLKLNNFSTMINSFCVVNKNKDAYETANHIAISSGLLKMLREENTPEAISRVENIEELLNGIKEFTEKAIEKSEGDMSVRKTLDEYMEDVALLTDADSDDDEDRDKVMLMTIHASKGLEFPHVYIVGLEENLFPSIQSITTRTELEEERRLFYVALTRAMETVTLSHAETRYRWGNFTITEPSRFLDEIEEGLIDKPKESLNPSNRESNFSKTRSDVGQHSFKKRNLMPLSNSGAEPTEDSDISELKSGADVEHAKFGRGKVISIEGSGPNKKATVFFNSVGNKNLLLRFAKLKIV